MNRYLIAKGLDSRMGLYWYQAHGRVVASEYWAKFYLVADAVAMNRSDGAFVRMVTRLLPDENTESGERRVVGFAEQVLPMLDKYIPD